MDAITQSRSVIIALLLTLFTSANGLADEKTLSSKRAILIIGNSEYAHVQKLKNPRNDATALGALFKELEFEVDLHLDLNYQDMRRAIRNFSDKSRDKNVAAIYFSGHGLELGGENYLIPTDAFLKRDVDLDYEAVTLSSLLLAVRQARKLRLVILDACRDNPFNRRMESAILTRSVSRGLGLIEPSGDILVAYSAKAGTIALDGDGEHSPFTTALKKHLATPGLDIRLIMGRVRDDVRKVTKGRQEPFTYGSLSGEVIALVPPSDATDTATQSYLLAQERKRAAEAEAERKREEARAANAELRRREAEEQAELDRLSAKEARAAREREVTRRREAEEQAERDRVAAESARAAKEEAERELEVARQLEEQERERIALEAEQHRMEMERKARILTFSVQSDFPYSVDLSFYSSTGSRAWPGGNQVWILNDSLQHEYSLACIPGEKICYGAWVRGNTTRYWGAGYGGRQGCQACCYTCGAGDTQLIRLLP